MTVSDQDDWGDPLERFSAEYNKALASEPFDAARCALATVDQAGLPSVRFVLLKPAVDGRFVFYTNFDSAKAADLTAVSHAALAFHWHTTGVQIRVRGPVVIVPEADSDRYFATRPRGSQLGAWASSQSERLNSRDLLEQRLAEFTQRFAGKDIPRPSFWGGYRIEPDRIEFWYNREDRLHDRFAYTRAQHGWECVRLFP